MQRNSYKYYLIIIMFGIVLTGITICNTIEHEKVHQQIDLQNGCEESIIKYTINGGETTGYNCKINNNRDILHTQNEIINYNNNTIILTIFLSCMLICLTIMGVSEKHE